MAEPRDDMVSRVIADQVRPGHLTVEAFAEIGAMILRAGHDHLALDPQCASASLLDLDTASRMGPSARPICRIRCCHRRHRC